MKIDRCAAKRSMPLVLLVVLAQLGCGPKVSDVLKKYEPDFKKKREQIQTIAHALPPKATEKPCASMNPPLQFNESTKQYNTEMMMFEQALDPDAEPAFDLRLRADLLLGLRWTGPQNPLSSSGPNNRGSDMEKMLKAALDYRYLVVNRAVNLKNPVAVNEKTFTAGRVTIESFVVNLDNNEVACSFAIQAQSAAETSYSYKQGENPQDRLQAFAESSMWEDARKKVIAKLKQMTGGDIVIN